MDQKIVKVNSMGLHHSREYFTSLEGNTNPSNTMCKGQVPDETGKGLSIIIINRPKKDQ